MFVCMFSDRCVCVYVCGCVVGGRGMVRMEKRGRLQMLLNIYTAAISRDNANESYNNHIVLIEDKESKNSEGKSEFSVTKTERFE